MSEKKIGIGFVGAGWMGTALLQKLNEREDVEILALHQRNREKAINSLNSLGLKNDLYCESYDKLLNNKRIDAVFIATTNEAHGQQAIAALEADKHVFCEKPCATEFNDYVKQIELAREKPHLITFVDYLMNFDSMENHLQEMISEDTFGKLTQVQVNYRHPVNIAGDKLWKLDRKYIGDAIGQGIIHSLSIMLNLLKAQKAEPIKVYATKSDISSRGFQVPAVWNIQVEFDNDSTGFCFGNIDHANGYDAYHNIHGTEGGFIFDSYLDRPQKVRLWSNKTTNGKWIYPLDNKRDQDPSYLWPANTTTPDSGDVMNHQTGECVAHFIECIKQGKQSFLSFEQSSPVAEVGWASLISAELGDPVELPLDIQKAKAFFAE